jgi:hypothetical protein
MYQLVKEIYNTKPLIVFIKNAKYVSYIIWGPPAANDPCSGNISVLFVGVFKLWRRDHACKIGPA